MANYIKRPEPGRFRKQETIVEKPKQEGLDSAALANAVAQAINLRMPNQIMVGEVEKTEDSFDNSKTLARIADQMIIQRGDNKSNFEDLGKIKKTKKNKQDVDDTINLLSQLDN